MNARQFTGIALVALALLLTFAAPSRGDDFTFTTHVILPNPATNSEMQYECWLAMNGRTDTVSLGSQWASPDSEVVFVVNGSPTLLLSGGCLGEIRATNELGEVTHYRCEELDWEVQVLTTGTHQDIFLKLRAVRPASPPSR